MGLTQSSNNKIEPWTTTKASIYNSNPRRHNSHTDWSLQSVNPKEIHSETWNSREQIEKKLLGSRMKMKNKSRSKRCLTSNWKERGLEQCRSILYKLAFTTLVFNHVRLGLSFCYSNSIAVTISNPCS